MCEKCNSHDHSTEQCGGGKTPAASAGYDLASPETLEDRVHFLECLVLEQQKAIELLAGNAASELRAKIGKIKASARLLALLQKS